VLEFLNDVSIGLSDQKVKEVQFSNRTEREQWERRLRGNWKSSNKVN